MEAINRFFAAADETIQREFDSVIFFLMRHCGWRKSIIRYAVWALMALTTLVILYARWLIHKRTPHWSMVGDLFFLPIVFWIQRQYYQHDLAAEKRGVMSIADARFLVALSRLKIFCWCVFVFFVESVIVGSMFPDKKEPFLVHVVIVKDVGNAFTYLLYLVLLYLAKTPNTPPPREEKARGLVPATQPVP